MTFISDYVKKVLTKRCIRKALWDTVNKCLELNQGLGCLYYTMLDGGNTTVHYLEENNPLYFVIVKHDDRKYAIIKDNLIVFQGDYRSDQDPVTVARSDFRTYRNLSQAIEIAAVGMWEYLDEFLDYNYEDIMHDIERMDISCGMTAHTLRLRVNT